MIELNKKANRLRHDLIRLVHKAPDSHVGGSLSVLDILTTLYFKVMNVSPKNIEDPNRDRFILSKAHTVDALYVVLAEKGFFDKEELIKTFFKFNSPFIGHPNSEVPGIEMSGGSLGHGLSLGVGMALAAKMDNLTFRTYVVLGDGEMAEGSNFEAMMSAAHYKLDNLCATVDLNGLQISGKTKDVMCLDDMGEKFKAFNWHVIEVENGNDCIELEKAYTEAATVKGKPTVVIAHTVKGKGISFMENNLKWHHGAPSDAEYLKAIEELQEAYNEFK